MRRYSEALEVLDVRVDGACYEGELPGYVGTYSGLVTLQRTRDSQGDGRLWEHALCQLARVKRWSRAQQVLAMAK